MYVTREACITEQIVNKSGLIRAGDKRVPAGAKHFPFSSATRTCLGLNQPPSPPPFDGHRGLFSLG
jgi:hypothetical protein